MLSGQIRRGDGETIRAAIVWGDLRGSTAMAERLVGREAYTETLNLFFTLWRERSRMPAARS